MIIFRDGCEGLFRNSYTNFSNKLILHETKKIVKCIEVT